MTMNEEEPILESQVDEPASSEVTDEAPSTEEVDEIDLRQTPEYQHARGTILLLAYLFFGLLAFMCIAVAVIVVYLLTSS